ncbi:LOW QUALITY PROTEIN: hypothetical protein CFOL_v3_07965, partial [Cephalotus follicularis]
MMAGNPSWWSVCSPSQQPSTFLSPPLSLFPSQYVLGSSSLPLDSFVDNQELPQSWSQLLLGRLSGDEERFGPSDSQHRKLENWEDQIPNPSPRVNVIDVKQEVSLNSNLYGHGSEDFHAPRPAWSQILPVSSPRSCVTTLSSNVLDFSYNKADGSNQHPDHSSEGNSTDTGGVCKKARVKSSSSQPPLKVRKEKLGDRITALHQLVSPFGKTDTASVLLEAIGYIRFLQGQIEALSSPYLDTSSSSNIRNQERVQGERNCVFISRRTRAGMLIGLITLINKSKIEKLLENKPKDLRGKGLCLVPVSFSQQVGSDNGADYWAPALGGGF